MNANDLWKTGLLSAAICLATLRGTPAQMPEGVELDFGSKETARDVLSRLGYRDALMLNRAYCLNWATERGGNDDAVGLAGIFIRSGEPDLVVFCYGAETIPEGDARRMCRNLELILVRVEGAKVICRRGGGA